LSSPERDLAAIPCGLFSAHSGAYPVPFATSVTEGHPVSRLGMEPK